MIPPTLRIQTPPLWTGPVCAYPYSETLARQFTVASRFDNDTPMQLWSEIDSDQGKLIGLPWNCCPPSAKDLRVSGTPVNLSAKIGPRDAEQERCFEEAWSFMSKGQSGVLQMPTGSGKTIVAYLLMTRLQTTTCVIVPKDDLVDQWIERAKFALGLSPHEIGRIQGDALDVKGKPIVIASLRSVFKQNRYPPWVYRYFGLVVVDEVHRIGADLMSETMHRFYAKQRLGLSATPKRADGKDLMIEAHIGPIRVSGTKMALKPKIIVVGTNWKCPRDKNGDRIPHTAGRLALIFKSLSRNGPRNSQLCKAVQAAYLKGRRTVLFSEHIDHHEMLESLLPKFGIKPTDIGRYYGPTTKAQNDNAAKKLVILATPGKMAEGTDIPELDTLVLAMPRSNIEQIVGRILRIHPDKKPPIVFDFVDPDSHVLKSAAKRRMEFYRRIGAEVVEHTIAA